MADGWFKRTFGRKQRFTGDGSPIIEFSPAVIQALHLGDFRASYASLYRQQPAVRTVVDFLARNIAQLNLKTYRKVSQTDRQEIPQHDLARLIQSPNPETTRYRLIHGTISDLAIYDNAYWVKQEVNGRRALIRVPPAFVVPDSASWFSIKQYKIADGTIVTRDNMVHFHGYHPDDLRVGMSPLESLRRTLAEDYAAMQQREFYWKNAARRDGIIQRPADAPEWSEKAKKRFREEWQASHSGAMNAGKAPVLEDGMVWNPDSFSPKDSEYIAGRRLTREEVARVYHIPLPLVGILENATFSNITEQHKMLYVDTMGPWLAMIEQEIALQLLPWFVDQDGVYVEFNIEEKLQGSFAEQAALLTSAVGGPWMLRAEARSRMNLPQLPDDQNTDDLIIPGNVVIGGQPAPNVLLPAQPKALPDGVVELRAAE